MLLFLHLKCWWKYQCNPGPGTGPRAWGGGRGSRGGGGGEDPGGWGSQLWWWLCKLPMLFERVITASFIFSAPLMVSLICSEQCGIVCTDGEAKTTKNNQSTKTKHKQKRQRREVTDERRKEEKQSLAVLKNPGAKPASSTFSKGGRRGLSPNPALLPSPFLSFTWRLPVTFYLGGGGVGGGAWSTNYFYYKIIFFSIYIPLIPIIQPRLVARTNPNLLVLCIFEDSVHGLMDLHTKITCKECWHPIVWPSFMLPSCCISGLSCLGWALLVSTPLRFLLFWNHFPLWYWNARSEICANQHQDPTHLHTSLRLCSPIEILPIFISSQHCRRFHSNLSAESSVGSSAEHTISSQVGASSVSLERGNGNLW